MNKWLIKLCDKIISMVQSLKNKLAHEVLHNEYHVKSDVEKDIPTYYSLIEREWGLYSTSVHSLLDLVEEWGEFKGAKNFRECWEILKIVILRDHYIAKDMDELNKLIDIIKPIKAGYKQYEIISGENYVIVNWGYMHHLWDCEEEYEKLISVKKEIKTEWGKGESNDYTKYILSSVNEIKGKD